MKSISIYKFIFACCILVGCNQKDTSNSKPEKISYEILDSLSIDIPFNINTNFTIKRILNNNGRILFAGLSDNQVHIFDFESGKHTNSYSFPKEGPQSHGEVKDFFYINQDSIIGLYPSKNILQLINSNSIVQHEYNVDTNLYGNLGIESFHAARRSDILQYDNYTKSIYLRTYPEGNYYGSVEPYKQKTKIRYSLTTEEVTHVFGFFPELLQDKNYFHTNDHIFGYNFIRINNDSSLNIFTFNRDSHIYNNNIFTEKISELANLESSFIPENYPLVKRGADLFETLTPAYIREPRFEYTLIDDKLNLYRVVKHSSEYLDRERNYAPLSKTSFSILKFTKLFNPNGEAEFPNKTYSINNIFPYKDDLLLFQLQKENDETIKFHIIQIK